MRRFGLLLLVLLSLPILIHLYQPGLMYFNSAGATLGTIGATISPLILFGLLARFVLIGWFKPQEKSTPSKS